MNQTPPKLPVTQPPPLTGGSPQSDNENLWLITVLSALGLVLLIMLALFFLLRTDASGGAKSVAETTPDSGTAQDSSEDSSTVEPAEAANEQRDGSSPDVDEPEQENGAPKSLTEDTETPEESTNQNLETETTAEPNDTESSSNKGEELNELPSLNSGTIVGDFGQSRGSLFGVEFTGDRIAYVIDYSVSMEYRFDSSNLTRLQKAQQELIKSVENLKQDQLFTAILFNEQVIDSPDFINATPSKNITKKLSQWLNSHSVDGSTDLIPVMEQILGEDYDVIFLISDGDFPAFMVQDTKTLNKKNTVIHTISLGSESRMLKKIAQENKCRSGLVPFVSKIECRLEVLVCCAFCRRVRFDESNRYSMLTE